MLHRLPVKHLTPESSRMKRGYTMEIAEGLLHAWALMALILAFPVPRGIPGIAVTHRTIPHLLSFHFQGPVASTQ
eukprot:scaffold63501_cov17-Tisochrysis_lutea.AAC.1